MKKNEEYIVQVESYTIEGLALAKIGAFVVFIPGLLRGEIAKIALTKVKNNYAYARVVEILSASQERVQTKCTIAKLCGGCQLQYMSYKEQLYLKKEILCNYFRVNNLSLDVIQDVIASPKIQRYRNKVQVPIQEKKEKALIGFYRHHSHDVVVYEDCLLQTETSNKISKLIKEFLDDNKIVSPFRYLFIRHIHERNELMVMPIVRSYPFYKAKELAMFLKKKVENIVSFSYLKNDKSTNVILDGPIYAIFGPHFMQEKLLDMEFQLSAKSFFQVNPYATKILYTKALLLASLTKNDTLVDLYCGTGTIGILAAKKVKKVIGIEIVPEAIENAKKNALINGCDNISFWCLDAKDGAKRIVEEKEKIDVVIVDPPRKGCSLSTLESIMQMKPKRLVYVSCGPASLARDLVILQKMNFHIQLVQPVDMFPYTTHVECIALIQRVKS